MNYVVTGLLKQNTNSIPHITNMNTVCKQACAYFAMMVAECVLPLAVFAGGSPLGKKLADPGIDGASGLFFLLNTAPLADLAKKIENQLRIKTKPPH